jgi:hypothetical protein
MYLFIVATGVISIVAGIYSKNNMFIGIGIVLLAIGIYQKLRCFRWCIFEGYSNHNFAQSAKQRMRIGGLRP